MLEGNKFLLFQLPQLKIAHVCEWELVIFPHKYAMASDQIALISKPQIH